MASLVGRIGQTFGCREEVVSMAAQGEIDAAAAVGGVFGAGDPHMDG